MSKSEESLTAVEAQQLQIDRVWQKIRMAAAEGESQVNVPKKVVYDLGLDKVLLEKGFGIKPESYYGREYMVTVYWQALQEGQHDNS